MLGDQLNNSLTVSNKGLDIVTLSSEACYDEGIQYRFYLNHSWLACVPSSRMRTAALPGLRSSVRGEAERRDGGPGLSLVQTSVPGL